MVAINRRTVLVAACAALALSGLSACGFNAQTLQPYNPAEGVNADQATVKARNILLVVNLQGSGYLAGAFSSTVDDTFTGASGTAIKADGSPGAALAFSAASIPLPATRLTNLLDSRAVTVTSPDLKPGLSANVTLRFAKAGSITLIVPAVDATSEQYRGVSPSPRATPQT